MGEAHTLKASKWNTRLTVIISNLFLDFSLPLQKKKPNILYQEVLQITFGARPLKSSTYRVKGGPHLKTIKLYFIVGGPTP